MKQGRLSGLRNKYLPPVFSLILILCNLFANGQAIYNPSYTPLFTVSNKPYAMSQAGPDGGRTYKADSINFIWRPFNGVSEVLTYFPVSIPKYRTGQFPIEVNIGGALQSNGTFIGGQIFEYWWRNGQADSQLVLKAPINTTCTGCLLAANNLSDVANASLSLQNLGAGNMATQNIIAGGDLSGNWPNPTVAKFNGQLPAFYLNYNNLNNKPVGLSLTTTGFDAAATYNPTTGVLNIPVPTGGSGSPCLNCNADTLVHLPVDISANRNGWLLGLDTVDGKFVLYPPDTSGGTGGITSLNGLTANTQTFATGTAGTDFTIVSSVATHTFNIPVASAINTGKLSSTDWSSFNARLTGAGNIGSLFTTSLSGTTLVFTATTASAFSVYVNNTGSTAVPSFGKLTIPVLANSTANTIIGFDNSGAPANISAGTGISISGTTISATGSTSIPPNIGSGFTIYSPQVPGFKTLICSGCTIDSTTNANSLTFTVTGGGASPANPTGTIGLSVVNGSASTFMRSDAAPPLSQAISPTWTGSHVFNNPILTGTSNLAVGGWLYDNKIYTDASRALVTKDTANLIMQFYNANPLNYSQSMNFRQAVALLYNTLQSATIDTTTQGMLVFSDNFSRGSVGAAYTVASPGMTVSISTDGLELSAVTAPADYNNFITRTDSFGWTCAEKARIHFKYYNKVLNATSYGPMIAFHSQNAEGFPHTVLAAVQQYTGAANIGKAVLVGGDTQGYSAFASSGMGTISVGDTIDVSITRNGLVYTINCIDLNTAGTSTVVVPANQDGTPFPANNASTIAINFLGGDIVITQLDYTLLVPYRPDYLVFGNSIVWGQGSSTTPSQAFRFANMAFAQSNNVVVEGGGADYTAQFVNLLPEMRRINPKYAIAGALAGNDILFGISSGTWQANLQSIRDGLSNNSIPVIWFTDPPRSDVSTLPIRTYIAGNSDFSPDQQIFSSYDSLVNASATTMQSSYSGGGDGIHPNPNGHQKLGDLLASALPIQNGLTRIKLPIQVGGGGGYVLPTASTTVLGGVKVDGTTITISGGVISSTGGGTPGGASTSLQFNDGGAFNGFGLYTKATSLLSIGADATTPYADLSIDHNHSGITELNVANTNGAGIPFLQIAGDGAGGLLFGRRNTSAGNLGIWLAGMDALATSDASDLLIENTTAHDIFFGTNGSEKVRFKNSGVVQFDTYGSGTHTGTSAFCAAFDASGNIIEVSCSGGGAVSSVANSDGTLTISPTTGSVIASLALGHANTWSALQTFGTLTTTSTTIMSGLTSAGANDSIVTVDPSTGQLHRRSGTFNLIAANGIQPGVSSDSIIRGGTFNQNTSTAGAGFTLSEGTSGSPLGAYSVFASGMTLTTAGGNMTYSGTGMRNSTLISSNANITVGSGTNAMVIELFSITANRTLTLSGTTTGQTYEIDNASQSSGGIAFKWTFATTVLDFYTNTVTNVPIGRSKVFYNGSGWILVERPNVVQYFDVTGATTGNGLTQVQNVPYDCQYRIGGYITVTAVSVNVVSMTATYTDETNTSRTISLIPVGATAATVGATGVFALQDMTIRVKSGSSISMQTTVTGAGSITYDAGCSMTQIN